MSKIINFILRLIAKIFKFISFIFVSLFIMFISMALIIAPDGKIYTREQRFEAIKRFSNMLISFCKEEKKKREERNQYI